MPKRKVSLAKKNIFFPKAFKLCLQQILLLQRVARNALCSNSEIASVFALHACFQMVVADISPSFPPLSSSIAKCHFLNQRRGSPFIELSLSGMVSTANKKQKLFPFPLPGGEFPLQTARFRLVRRESSERRKTSTCIGRSKKDK